ncbi:hypothetical protein Tco_0871942 [Tanacetum coccineum]
MPHLQPYHQATLLTPIRKSDLKELLLSEDMTSDRNSPFLPSRSFLLIAKMVIWEVHDHSTCYMIDYELYKGNDEMKLCIDECAKIVLPKKETVEMLTVHLTLDGLWQKKKEVCNSNKSTSPPPTAPAAAILFQPSDRVICENICDGKGESIKRNESGHNNKEQDRSILFGLPGSRQQKFLVLRFFDVKEQQGVHGVHDEKRVWFEVELQGAQGDRGAEVFQVSNDDTVVAQRWLEDKQPKEKTNTDCLVKEQDKEYQTGWKIKTGNVPNSCNQRSTQQCTKSGVAKHLGVAGLQQQNGLVKETNVTLLAKVRYFLIQSGHVYISSEQCHHHQRLDLRRL